MEEKERERKRKEKGEREGSEEERSLGQKNGCELSYILLKIPG